MTTDLALIIVFAVIIIALIISSLIGLWKGCWKTGFKMIFRIILFIVLIFTAQPITNFFSTINFQTTFGADFQIEGIQFTSLNDFLINILMEKGNISPVTGQSLYATCEALAHSILSFAFFLLYAMMLLLASPFRRKKRPCWTVGFLEHSVHTHMRTYVYCFGQKKSGKIVGSDECT